MDEELSCKCGSSHELLGAVNAAQMLKPQESFPSSSAVAKRRCFDGYETLRAVADRSGWRHSFHNGYVIKIGTLDNNRCFRPSMPLEGIPFVISARALSLFERQASCGNRQAFMTRKWHQDRHFREP